MFGKLNVAALILIRILLDLHNLAVTWCWQADMCVTSEGLYFLVWRI
jgi:hypothetical protein